MPGRPRSEEARLAVLHAVDDLLVEVGYGAMTMKGIADRAGVGRQTVYRWWSTKAEILLEACLDDAGEALATRPEPDPAADLLAYLTALSAFLTDHPAGIAYRALLGESQHDRDVRRLVHDAALLRRSAGAVLERVGPAAAGMPGPELAFAQLVGPVLVPLLTGADALPGAALRRHVECLLAGWHQAPAGAGSPPPDLVGSEARRPVGTGEGT